MIAWLLALIPAALLGWLKKALIIGAVGSVIALGAYLKGRSDANANCRDAELKARIAILEFDLKTARELADLGFKQTQAQEVETKSLEQKVAAYEAVLAARPDDRCALSDDDARRLRGIVP